MHIHIPDGILPVWIWGLGLALIAILLVFAAIKVKKDRKRMPLAAMLTALVLLVMSLPIGLPVHMNLMVLVGILLGSYWSLIISFTANLILASFAHGGITIIGLNTLVLWTQALLGIIIFKGLSGVLKSEFVRGGVSAFVAITLSFFLVVGMVSASNLDTREVFFDGDHHEEEHHEEEHEELFSVKIFLIVALPFVLWGATAESLVTGFVIKYLGRARPDLLE